MYVDTRQRLKIRIEIDSNLENLRQNFIFVQNAAKIFMYVQACQTSIARNFAYAHSSSQSTSTHSFLKLVVFTGCYERRVRLNQTSGRG
jgi:hypothetical protein